MKISTYDISKEELEDFADNAKAVAVHALIEEDLLTAEKGEEWCKSHTIIFRKKSFFRTISNKWFKTEDDEGLIPIVVKRIWKQDESST